MKFHRHGKETRAWVRSRLFKKFAIREVLAPVVKAASLEVKVSKTVAKSPTAVVTIRNPYKTIVGKGPQFFTGSAASVTLNDRCWEPTTQAGSNFEFAPHVSAMILDTPIND